MQTPTAIMETNPRDSSESDSEEVVEYTIKLKPKPEEPKYYNPPLLWKKIKYKSEFQPEGLLTTIFKIKYSINLINLL